MLIRLVFCTTHETVVHNASWYDLSQLVNSDYQECQEFHRQVHHTYTTSTPQTVDSSLVTPHSSLRTPHSALTSHMQRAQPPTRPDPSLLAVYLFRHLQRAAEEALLWLAEPDTRPAHPLVFSF
jgi:hypothetical protein